ncbi:MAG TPA: AarF/UbiB family protein [Opitutaceae bacterium]|nr:AarF/UbiB family protein [Opitutaceae bacterium]
MKPLDFFSNAVRAKDIFTVLAKHGFADLLSQIDPPSGLFKKIVPRPRENRSTWERIRLASEELGPTFVKFGQLMSMRPDVIPHGLVLELRKLQNEVHPLPFAQMRPVLEAGLEREFTEVFSDFNETAVASASLAQVYFARLKVEGRPVAIKIQRPNLTKTVEADLDIITWLASQVHQRIDKLRPYNLPAVVEEIKQGIRRELDFRNEARNQQFFNAQNPFTTEVFAPIALLELSSEHVLVMERIDGSPVTSCPLSAEKSKALAAAGAKSLLHQIIIAGFFHADPHAGNVLVSSDGRLCFLDWGLAGHLTRRLRYALADLFVAAASQEAEQVVQIAANLAGPVGKPDLRSMEKEVTLALREELNYAIGRQQLGRVMLKMLHIFGRNGINITSDYSLMAKAVVSIEEVGRALDPHFDLREQAKPILKQLQEERTGIKAIIKNSRNLARSMLSSLQDLPNELYRIVRRIDQDNLTINLQHRGLGDLEDSIKIASNRITLGVIIGSLIMGSSLIINTKIPPFLFGYPALGIVGYLLSAVLGLYIVWDIFLHGRHK